MLKDVNNWKNKHEEQSYSAYKMMRVKNEIVELCVREEIDYGTLLKNL